MTSALPRSILIHDDLSNTTASITFLRQLRIAGSKSRSSNQLRRRTESVNTVLSSCSIVGNLTDLSSPDIEGVARNSETEKQYDMTLDWLEKECPSDVVPKILAFCGPQQVASLSITNKHWNSVIRQEKTWRVMCEELYKVCRKNFGGSRPF
jgi:hypothetical protein